MPIRKLHGEAMEYEGLHDPSMKKIYYFLNINFLLYKSKGPKTSSEMGWEKNRRCPQIAQVSPTIKEFDEPLPLRFYHWIME